MPFGGVHYRLSLAAAMASFRGILNISPLPVTSSRPRIRNERLTGRGVPARVSKKEFIN